MKRLKRLHFLILSILICGGVVANNGFTVPSDLYPRTEGEPEMQSMPNANEIVTRGQIVPTKFKTNGYRIYSYPVEYVLPVEAGLRAFAVKNQEIRSLMTVSDVSSIVESIENEEQALSFARLFTDSETHFLFNDPQLRGIEIQEEKKGLERIPEQIWEKIKDRKTSVIKDKDGQFVIKRLLVVSKPRETIDFNNDNGFSFVLIQSRETISRDGKFDFEVEEIISDGEWLNNLSRGYR